MSRYGRRSLQLAARQGAGRIERAQLHAVRAGQPARLRPVGATGQSGLGLRHRAALLQEVGRQSQSVPGADRLPPGRWLSHRAGVALAHAAGGGFRRRRSPIRISGQRHQRPATVWLHDRPGNTTPDRRATAVTQRPAESTLRKSRVSTFLAAVADGRVSELAPETVRRVYGAVFTAGQN